VTERGLPIGDGATACPFVAFEDDRDERASVPDHRHRCYADVQPAPRALAHQEAYCLSTAFPVCPTFQDWARREAARTKAGSASTRSEADQAKLTEGLAAGGALAAASVANAAGSGDGDDERAGEAEMATPAAAVDANPPADPVDDLPPRRNPPRDWAAPPPWLASAEAGRDPGAEADAPDFLARRGAEPGQGLAGSAADRLAGGPPRSAVEDERHVTRDEEWRQRDEDRLAREDARDHARAERPVPDDRAMRRRDEGHGQDDRDDHDRELPRRRPRAYAQHLGGPDGPDWEQPRRYEAYPQIRSRMELPNAPRLVVLAAALVIAAVALFFLPTLLGMIGGSGSPSGAGPSASVGPSASIVPTPTPAPTPELYTIKKGDTLSKIASAHGVTVDEILAANKDRIKNPNLIGEGLQIVIPRPSGEPSEASGSARPSASAAP
jgi:LysM repeat protein